MTWNEFARDFLGWKFYEDGNVNKNRRRWTPADDEEMEHFNQLLDSFGHDDFAYAVKVAGDQEWKTCHNSKYVEKLLVRWQKHRVRFLESVSREDWDEELCVLLEEWGNLLTFEVDAKQIRDLLQSFPDWWVARALRLSVERRAGNIRYVQRILYNWEAAGGVDVAEATSQQRSRLKGALKYSGRQLEEFTSVPLHNLSAKAASDLLPTLEALPKKEPSFYDIRVSTTEWHESRRGADGRGVYFIQQEPWGRGGGPIKIGISDHPADRLTSLQSGNPDKLCLIAVVSQKRGQGNAQEKAMHEKFAELSIFGEWFRAEDPLMLFIENLPSFSGWHGS